MPEKILATGAEAILLQQNCNIIKRRVKKAYRIPEIDEKLRKLRTRSEAKLLEKLQNKINVPKILKIDEKNKEIIMEFIEGKKLSENLDNFSLNKQIEICREIGKEVSKIHDLDIIHGDLTTSNMILAENSENKEKPIKNKTLLKQMSDNINDLTDIKESKIFFIDFGLSFHSSRIEDKAVDLHLLRQALESRHFQDWQKLFKAVIFGYKSRGKEKILAQLEKVEKRGRYKKNE